MKNKLSRESVFALVESGETDWKDISMLNYFARKVHFQRLIGCRLYGVRN